MTSAAKEIIWSLPRPISRAIRRMARRLHGPEFDEVTVVHSLLRGSEPRVMVDVGAHLGASAALFADDGWTVLALEPDPRNRAALERRYHRYENVVVDPRAVSEVDGERLPLFTSAVSTGISTLTPFHPSHRATAQVETVRLDTYLRHVTAVTFVKTDVEGHDLFALRTYPWDRLKPRVVMAEFEDSKTTPLGYGYHDLAGFLAGLGFAVFVSEWMPITQYGRRHRWRSLRRYPADLADNRGWGNLIAVEPSLSARLSEFGST